MEVSKVFEGYGIWWRLGYRTWENLGVKDDAEVFVLGNQEDAIVIYWDRKLLQEEKVGEGLGRADQELGLGQVVGDT